MLERIRDIRAENDQLSSLSREQAIRFLTEVVQTPLDRVDESSPLAQEVTTERSRLKRQAGATAKAAPKVVPLDREALCAWCERVILAKPTDANLDSDICEVVMLATGTRIAVLCPKVEAAELLMRLRGWEVGTEAANKQADPLGVFAGHR